MKNVVAMHTCSDMRKLLSTTCLHGDGMIICCLCQTELKSDKKKKLHNQACAEEWKLLETFLREETGGDDAWLCYSCQSELLRLDKLRTTAEGLEKSLHDLWMNLHMVGPARGEDLLRKRLLAGRTSSPRAFCAQVEDVSDKPGRQPTESPPVAVS